MSDSDWRPITSLGALAALVIFAVAALSAHSVTSRGGVGNSVEQKGIERRACDPEDDNYYQCEDLVAQEGMRGATDRLASQGDLQLWLGSLNAGLLLVTLGASIVATFIAGRAVKVARSDMENALQPRLAIEFTDTNWNPIEKTTAAIDPLAGVSMDDSPEDATTFRFHNYGEAAAFYLMLHARHFWRDERDGFPPQIRPMEVKKNFASFPEGNWVKAGENTQEWHIKPDEDVANDPPPVTKDRAWYVMGFIVYEGLAGVRYITQFCCVFDKLQGRWVVREPALGTRPRYNGTAKIDTAWIRRRQRERDLAAQQ